MYKKNDTINDLYEQLYSDKSTKEPRTFITIVQVNENLINRDGYENYDENWKFTRIISDYGLALYHDGYISKSILILEKAMRLIENDEKIIGKDYLTDPLYEQMLFYHGMALYDGKKYKLAKNDFKKLIEKFKENDKYKNWYNGSVKMIYKNIEWFFLILTIIAFIMTITLKKEDGIIDKISFYVLVISIIGSLITDFFKKRQIIR